MKHYVYTLADPRDGVIFYVGKGQKDRAWVHERNVRQGKVERNYPKFAKIREIIQAGLTVAVSIVAKYATASEAFDHEERLIAEIGLNNLTNILPGGGGVILRRSPVTQKIKRAWAQSALKRLLSFPEWLRTYRADRVFKDPLKSYCQFKDSLTGVATGAPGCETDRLAKIDATIASSGIAGLLISIFGKSNPTEEDILAKLRLMPERDKAELWQMCQLDAARG